MKRGDEGLPEYSSVFYEALVSMFNLCEEHMCKVMIDLLDSLVDELHWCSMHFDERIDGIYKNG